MNLLDLPGVAAFIRRIVRDLDHRRNAFVHMPEVVDRDDLRSRIKQLVRQGDVSLWEELSVHELAKLDPWPITSLVRRYEVEVTGSDSLLVDLCRSASFQGRVIWLEGLGGGTERLRANWLETLRQYARQSHVVPQCDRTVFCILVGANVETRDDVWISHHWWWGVVSRVDMMLLVRGFTGDALPTLPRHPDLIVDLERCAMTDNDVRLQPPPRLEIPWEKGIVNFRPEDGVSVHCAVLDDERLHRRLWQAQIRAIFPFIDEQRANVCAYLERRHHDLARRWLEGGGRDWPLLEVAELDRLFHSCPRLRGDNHRRVGELVEWLHDARNELAHWKVLDPARIEAGLHLAHRAAKYTASD